VYQFGENKIVWATFWATYWATNSSGHPGWVHVAMSGDKFFFSREQKKVDFLCFVFLCQWKKSVSQFFLASELGTG
jgi:hypothetical protein